MARIASAVAPQPASIGTPIDTTCRYWPKCRSCHSESQRYGPPYVIAQ